MARKKKHEEHVNHERWLVSYADFITLLFATFTALFAISNADKEKYMKFARSVKEAFNDSPRAVMELPNVLSEGGTDRNGNLIITINNSPTSKRNNSTDGEKDGGGPEDDAGAGVVPETEPAESEPTPTPAPELSTIPTPEATATPAASATPGATVTPVPGVPGDGGPGAAIAPTPGPTGTPMPTEGNADPALAQEIQQMVETAGLEGKVEVRQEKRGMVISLGETAFFPPGEVDVQPQSTHQLDRVINLLRNKKLEIRVEGHTDDTPVRSGRFRNNLELSTLRAARIVDFMVNEYGFPPQELSSAGYGEYRPIAENSTPEGRNRNRRVDIVVLSRREVENEPQMQAVRTSASEHSGPDAPRPVAGHAALPGTAAPAAAPAHGSPAPSGH